MSQHSPMLRSALVLAIVVLYNHLTSAAEPASLAATSREETFEIARGGAVPFVTIETCDRKLQFIVNTVPRQTIFAKRYRHLLGSPREDNRESAVGEMEPQFEVFSAPAMRLGRLAPEIDSVLAMDFGNLEERIGRRLDGCLGLDILRQYVVEFDFDHGVLRFLSEVPADPGEKIPLVTLPDGLRAVEFSLGGEPARLFTPATCAPVTVAMRPALFMKFCHHGTVQLPNRMNLALAAQSRHGVQGVATSTQLGGFVHREIQVETGEANYLGLDYLSRYVVTFDFPRENVYFKRAQNYDLASSTENSGLCVVWRNRQIVVDGIWPISPASESGFLEHDVIQRVNGEPAEAFSLFRLGRLLQEEGKTVSLTVRRGERALNLKLALRDFRNLEKEAAIRAIAERHENHSRGDAKVLAELAVARFGAPLTIPIRLEGIERPLLMLFDTGTSQSIYDQRLRARLGASLGTKDVNTAFGPTRDEQVRAPAVTLEKIELSRESICFIADLKQLREETGCDLDGVLGMDLLYKQIVQIDFDAGKLRLLSAVPVGAGERIPIEYRPSGTPAVIADVGSMQQEWFVLDTGSMMAGSGVTKHIFQQLNTRNELTNIEQIWHRDPFGRAAPAAAAAGNVSSIALGPFQHKSLKVAWTNENVLGLAYLARYLVTFDFSGRAVYLKESSRYAQPENDDMSGLRFVKRDKSFIVDRVTPAGQGDVAGFKAGDAIVRVNGDDSWNYSLAELRNIFMTEGQSVNAVVLREGEELELLLELRDYSDVRRKKLGKRTE